MPNEYSKYDFFDITMLPYDPPDKAGKKVKTAIEKTKKDLKSLLAYATQQLERDIINGKLTFLDAKTAEIFDEYGRLSLRYDELAQFRKTEVMTELKTAIEIVKDAGVHVVFSWTLRMQGIATQLSKESIEKVYLDTGFTILKIDPLAVYPKFPSHADRINTELEALWKIIDTNPQGKDMTLAVDLYAFIAYLCGEPENATEYRSKLTPELCSLLDRFSKQFSTRNDNLGKLCASLATCGKLYVFNTEDSRRAYETHLTYRNPALSRFFGSLKHLTQSELKNRQVKSHCIKVIMKYFDNEAIALAIYNKEARLRDDPYIAERDVKNG